MSLNWDKMSRSSVGSRGWPTALSRSVVGWEQLKKEMPTSNGGSLIFRAPRFLQGYDRAYSVYYTSLGALRLIAFSRT